MSTWFLVALAYGWCSGAVYVCLTNDGQPQSWRTFALSLAWLPVLLAGIACAYWLDARAALKRRFR